jgi:hypothetical protein
MTLERELETYRREVARLLAEGHRDKFALIKGEQVDSVWDTQDDALRAGYDRFGLDEPFMVKQIKDAEKVYYFSRNIAPCQ